MKRPIRYAVIDFETFYGDDYSLRKMTTQQYIRDPRFRVHGVGIKVGDAPSRWVSHDHVERALRMVLDDRTVLICHNASFDASIIQWVYGIRPHLIIDTISLARAMLGAWTTGFSLDHLGKVLFDEGKSGAGAALNAVKGVRNLPPYMEASLAAYCKGDCDLTWRLFRHLWPAFPKEEALVIDWVARAFTEPTLLLDVDMLTNNAERIESEHDALVEELGLESATGVVSNAQLAQRLVTLGVTPPLKPSPTTGLPTYAFAKTDVAFLKLLEHPNKEVSQLVNARLKLKQSMEKTRSWSYAAAGTLGPWPVDLRYSGAVTTHRLSGGMGGGGNPQNMGRNGVLRQAVSAPPGYTLVVVDQSQIELRITLGLAGEDDALEVLRGGECLYCWFASDFYKRPVIKGVHKLERQVGKIAVLGLGFGMGKAKFEEFAGAANLGLTSQQCSMAVDLYRRKFSGVPALWQRAEHLLTAMFEGRSIDFPYRPICRTGHDPVTGSPCIFLPGGLSIKYPSLKRTSDGWSYGEGRNKAYIYGAKCVENIVQALARRTAVEKLLRINRKYRVALMAHDEIVAVVPDPEVEEAKVFMSACVNEPPIWWPDLPVSSEVGAGVRYGDAK